MFCTSSPFNPYSPLSRIFLDYNQKMEHVTMLPCRHQVEMRIFEIDRIARKIRKGCGDLEFSCPQCPMPVTILKSEHYSTVLAPCLLPDGIAVNEQFIKKFQKQSKASRDPKIQVIPCLYGTKFKKIPEPEQSQRAKPLKKSLPLPKSYQPFATPDSLCMIM